MFESQNLFKSIQCPFYSTTCERPYCPFKHPNQVQYEVVPGATSATTSSTTSSTGSIQTTQTKPDVTKSQPIKVPQTTTTTPQTAAEASTASAVAPSTSSNNIIENLSNALQTIQDLLKNPASLMAAVEAVKSNNAETQSKNKKDSEPPTNNMDENFLSQISTISSVLSTKTAPTSSSNTPLKPKPAPSPAKVKPVYTPTPINELKKLNSSVDQSPNKNGADVDQTLKRKIAETKATAVMTDSNQETRELNMVKKLKTEDQTATTKKCDIVSFSKLSLTQQMLKRYEMLNKPMPSQAELNESKLKKKKETEGAKPGAQTPVNPNVPQLILDNGTTQKVPLPMRQRFLKVIFDNVKPLHSDLKEACAKSSEEEKAIYDRSKNKTIYSNLVAMFIRNCRTKLNEKGLAAPAIVSNNKFTKVNNNAKVNKPPQEHASFSHEQILGGPKASRVSYSINRVKTLEIKDLSVTQLYKMFCAYVLSEKQLTDNSFPTWMSKGNDNNEEGQEWEQRKLAFIPNYSSTLSSTQGKVAPSTPVLTNEPKHVTRVCKRCSGNFNLIETLSEKIYSSNNSECVFHWGKLRSARFNKAVEQRYSCCSGDINTGGCEVGKHVFDGEYDGFGTGTNLVGYVETQDSHKYTTNEQLFRGIDSKTSSNIYALDCEMCYTTKGLELARVSIVDLDMKEIYEALVKPSAEILDYNTRWSGLTENSFKNTNKNLKQVQLDLLKLFNKDTILIGHSLESDFKALKLIHRNVVDTSVVFPHKLGPPYKRALRNLMSEHLQKIIQEDADGHDSKEDAASCIQLMLYKITEDLKSTKISESILNNTNNSSSNGNNLSQAKNSNSIYKLNNVIKPTTASSSLASKQTSSSALSSKSPTKTSTAQIASLKSKLKI